MSRQMLAAASREKKPFFINANICDPHRPFISGVGKKTKADLRGCDRQVGPILCQT